MKNHSQHRHRSASGYVVLISVLALGAIAVTLTTTVLLLGTGAMRTSFALEQSYEAKALADLCAEEALQQIQDSIPFEGSDTITLGQGECTYTVTKGTGQERDIESTGTVGTIVRRAHITLDTINPNINITAWEELADF